MTISEGITRNARKTHTRRGVDNGLFFLLLFLISNANYIWYYIQGKKSSTYLQEREREIEKKTKSLMFVIICQLGLATAFCFLFFHKWINIISRQSPLSATQGRRSLRSKIMHRHAPTSPPITSERVNYGLAMVFLLKRRTRSCSGKSPSRAEHQSLRALSWFQLNERSIDETLIEKRCLLSETWLISGVSSDSIALLLEMTVRIRSIPAIFYRNYWHMPKASDKHLKFKWEDRLRWIQWLECSLSLSLFIQFNPVPGAKKREENSSIISQLQNGISMTRKLLEQHDQLRNQERKLAIEMKSHESQAESIAQEFRTIVKRLNNTTKIMDYLRCLETFLKYRYLSRVD